MTKLDTKKYITTSFTIFNRSILLSAAIFLYVINPLNLLSQVVNLGNYQINNFSRVDYKGGTQNWDIDTLSNGHILIANNSGLLEFDGLKWRIHKLPNSTIVRSLDVNPNGRIYVGGQDEIGYFYPNKIGKLEFYDIRKHIPLKHLPLEDVWETNYLNGKVYYRSINKIYIYDENDEVFRVIDTGHTIISVFILNDIPHFSDMERGLVSTLDTSIIFPDSEFFIGKNILNAFEYGGGIHVITENNGLFRYKEGQFAPYSEQVQEYLLSNKIKSYCILSNGDLSLGTLTGGIIILNRKAEIVSYITKSKGLIDNSIYTQKLDKDNNLWVGSNTGISRINFSSKIKTIKPDGDQGGSYYDVVVHNNKLYSGSNSGLFIQDLFAENNKKKQNTKPISGTIGQVWGLDKMDGDLLMGHNNGAFIINEKSVKKISQSIGAWKFLEANTPKEMYVGTYQGVEVYIKVSSGWTFYKKLSGFNESSRILISVQPNEIWVSHPYRGVYRITHNNTYEVENIELYDEKRGLPSKLLNYIFDINGIPVVTAKTGIYKFDRKTNKFEPDPMLNTYIDPSKNTSRLIYNNNELWYIAENEVGVLKGYGSSNISKETYPELVGKFVGGFENLSILDQSTAAICSDDQLLLLDLQKQATDIQPSVFINEVRLTTAKDSLLYGGYQIFNNHLVYNQIQENEPELESNENALKINFSSANQIDGVTFSYRMLGMKDEAWSYYSSKTEKEYNNLTPGKYAFQVKALNTNGVESQLSTYSFRINPPWYLTKLALMVYLLLFFTMMSSIILIPKKKYQKEKQILTIAKEETEEQLDKVINDKLQAEINFKTSELASSTMHLVQKNETISKIKTELENVKANVKDPTAKRELKKVLSLLSDDERLEDDWENFSYHFDQVHTDFIKRISQSYPQLTPKDIKLSAYLRMNLTTKDIAPLLNISVRGVEISRYRLRKKIELDKETNLNEFMMGF